MAKQKLSDSEKIEQGYLQIRTIIEILGKPKEHIEKALKDHIAKIHEDKDLEVVEEFMEDAEEKEDEMYSTFCELTLWVKDVNKITDFCFSYMPSSIEVLEPNYVRFDSNALTDLFTDLQGRLHQVEMVAKTLHQENKNFNHTINRLIRNFIMVALGKKSRNLSDLSKITGLSEENLKPFVDAMLKENKIKEEEGVYSLIIPEA